MTDHFPCAACGKPTHIDDLDGKPERQRRSLAASVLRALWLWWSGRPSFEWDDPEGSQDWSRLECGDCYGPGYVSNRRAP